MVRFFAGHPTAANLLMIGFILLGLVFAGTVKRETLPDIPADSVEVRVPWPGASAADVEQGICLQLEIAADSVDEREETRCEAREGVAVATLVMREGADLERFLEDVKSQVDGIQDFPADAEAPVVRQLGRVDLVASIAVAGPLQPEGLKAYAERMKDDLLAIPGVARVQLQGFSQRQIRIEVSASTMRQFGLSVRDLADAVERQSVTLPAGSVESRDSTVLIRFDDERRNPRTFEGLVVVASASGAVIRLGDIATITDRFERAEDKNLFNGRRAAYLRVEKGRSDDTLNVIDAVRGYLHEQRALAPPGMVFEITRDVSSIVRDRLTMLLRNGAQGLLLVFLVMWLFFGLRYSFWVAAGLPVAFMGTIAGMAAIGYSFDMVTMVALLIAVGLMMDDAIVIAENIARHRAAGRPVMEAAVEGTREVAPGVLASFLTTIGVFGALAFLQGTIGAVLAVMPVVLILTLAFSLVEAFPDPAAPPVGDVARHARRIASQDTGSLRRRPGALHGRIRRASGGRGGLLALPHGGNGPGSVSRVRVRRGRRRAEVQALSRHRGQCHRGAPAAFPGDAAGPDRGRGETGGGGDPDRGRRVRLRPAGRREHGAEHRGAVQPQPGGQRVGRTPGHRQRRPGGTRFPLCVPG